MHDMETMRSAAGLSSSLVAYFVNNSLNKHGAMSACMDSIAEKVRIASTLLQRTMFAETISRSCATVR